MVFRFFCVGLIDFAVNFCCPYQCKWLPGGPSPKWPIMCPARHITGHFGDGPPGNHLLTHSFTFSRMARKKTLCIFCVRYTGQSSTSTRSCHGWSWLAPMNWRFIASTGSTQVVIARFFLTG